MNRFELKIATFMAMAYQLASLSTCPKRQVGCILLDKNLRVIGSGYNGVVSGMQHCNGKDCNCVHAEINALDNCKTRIDVTYIVTTCAPCSDCFSALANWPIETIYFAEESKHSIKSPLLVFVPPAPFVTPKWVAKKVGGSYQAAGTVVSEFNTKAGDTRVVFEFDTYPGMLHIFTPKQLLGSKTKQLVPCFGTKPDLSSKQVDEYNCRACQLKSECEKAWYSHDF